MDEQELIEEQRKSLEKSVEFFSSKNKPNREIWVLSEFIQNIGIPFEPIEIKKMEGKAPDIVFRGFPFEIKEIMDADRERHKEFKEELKKLSKVKKFSDLLEPYRPKDITPAQIGVLVETKLKDLNSKYAPDFRELTNLMLYVNLQSTYLKPGPLPSPDIFSKFGWMSVSALEGHASFVFHTTSNAPQILKKKQGLILVRNS